MYNTKNKLARYVHPPPTCTYQFKPAKKTIDRYAFGAKEILDMPKRPGENTGTYLLLSPLVSIAFSPGIHCFLPWYPLLSPLVSIAFSPGIYCFLPWYPLLSPLVSITFSPGIYCFLPWYLLLSPLVSIAFSPGIYCFLPWYLLL